MKRYRLLKDLPFAKAGAIFKEWTGERSGKEEKVLVNTNNLTTTLWAGDIEAFDEWFEEIAEPKWAYHINDHGDSISCIRVGSLPSSERYLKEIGNYFETKEKAEKYLEYLKAKAVIKKDIGGFKPDWEDMGELKYYGYWDCNVDEVDLGYTYADRTPDIYFQSEKDIKESFKKHPEEWRIYLTYEG